MTDKLPHEPTMEERLQAALTAVEWNKLEDAELILMRALQVLRAQDKSRDDNGS